MLFPNLLKKQKQERTLVLTLIINTGAESKSKVISPPNYWVLLPEKTSREQNVISKMDPLQSLIVVLNDTQFLMSIPNYKVAVQIEFKPRASLICFLKQGALLIRKVYAAFFPGSICGSSHQSSHSNQTLETHRDSVLCIVPLAFTLSIAIKLPEDRKQ